MALIVIFHAGIGAGAHVIEALIQDMAVAVEGLIGTTEGRAIERFLARDNGTLVADPPADDR